MNADYVYKQKLYKVMLSGHKAGQDTEKLTTLFRQAKYPPSLHRDWRYLASNAKAVVIAEWNGLSEAVALVAIKALRSCGASPELSEYERIVVFDDLVLETAFTRRYSPLGKDKNEPVSLKKHLSSQAKLMNELYSASILKMKDYALASWAKAEGLEEAYRLSILPSFQEPQIIRIFRKNNTFHLVYKVGQMPFAHKDTLDKNIEIILASQLFEKIKQFMDTHFWTAETWYSRYADSVFDGDIFLFEGWKDAKYKLLDDHSPNAGEISEQAYQLFRAIKIHAINEVLGKSNKFLPPIP